MTTATETARLLRRGTEPPAPPAPAAESRRRRRRPEGGRLVAWAFLAPLVAYLLVFYAFPLYRNLELSLKDYTVRSFVQGNAPFVWFDNYVQVFQDATFGPALLHTAIFTGVSLLFQFTLGLALAVFFYRRFPLASTLRALFLVPWLLPLIVSASTWSWMLNSDSGIVNAFLESFGIGQINWLTSPTTSLIAVLIANIWIGIPFNLVILYSGLQNISQDLYEAASLDGATGAQQFWRITLPLLRPVSAITILLGLVYTLKVFDIIWIMTKGGPADSSTTLATWTYQLGFGSMLPDFGPAAAVGNLLIILALVFGLVYIRVQRKQADS
ncbi:ABC transporter permease [Rathayibacter sp. AY1G1]|uniref:carbohydrate ABC transporter permease n=1 Tax=unclassified Rathayibacter TaxID=2609250 RepID=UPI000CE87249|nr:MULTISPECIES: sugar ABC transporter permease [unclassified Rathayibacter]PPG23946.1 ABC transporter permease [Rathayibacter sp. AY1E8]PPG23980.1 ABC transporter permease [Rathayibacter sp. AY1E8]PPH14666.1 ABC transporter permease [Rathayibacter sp. AY1G1]PPH41682.1 ABC transporter permease [Rathayibacter sp. AY1E4]